jgi:hypothetical protein
MVGSAEKLRFLRLAPKAVSLLLFVWFCATASVSHAQVDPTVCNAGSGDFEATFRTGVKVEVGPARKDGLATRMCQGSLLWDKNSLIVESSVAEVDIDVLGIDLGLGVPVVTFQVKESATDCCSKLLIYSLQKPPKLLRTIAGGGVFSTADRNLNGDVEIWVSDASSLKDFEDNTFRKPELAPVAVLRFERGRLLDAGSEFQSTFDQTIAADRNAIAPGDLRAFKNSDGRLAASAHFSPEELRQSQDLEQTKVRVLQIVWSYLYSGREEKAWSSLADLWPAADFERIKAEIIRGRGQGVLAQVEGASAAGRSTANTATIFDLRKQSATALPPPAGGRRVAMMPAVPALTPTVVQPVPIFIAHGVGQGESGDDFPATGMLDLTIDAAGKVRSFQATDPALEALVKGDTAGWKFIPAMSEGRPVASRIYMVVSPER